MSVGHKPHAAEVMWHGGKQSDVGDVQDQRPCKMSAATEIPENRMQSNGMQVLEQIHTPVAAPQIIHDYLGGPQVCPASISVLAPSKIEHNKHKHRCVSVSRPRLCLQSCSGLTSHSSCLLPWSATDAVTGLLVGQHTASTATASCWPA